MSDRPPASSGTSGANTARPANETMRLTALLAAGLLLAAFALQEGWHAVVKAPTFDEPSHIAAAWLTLTRGDYAYSANHPPLMRYLVGLSLLTVGPRTGEQPPLSTLSTLFDSGAMVKRHQYAQTFLFGNVVPAGRLLLAARLPGLGLGFLLVLLVLAWSWRLHGAWGGVLSLSLAAFCPNLIAHASLATTDLAGTAFGVLAVFALARWGDCPSHGRAAAAGAALGAALLTKLSAVVLAPLAMVAAAWVWRRSGAGRRTLLQLLVLLTAAWAVVSAGYGFRGLAVPHHLLQQGLAGGTVSPLARTLLGILPLPDAYLQGLAYVLGHASGSDLTYLLGRTSAEGSWFYFPVALAVKTPVASLLVLLGAGLLGAVRLSKRAAGPAPAPDGVLIVLAASLVTGMAIGSRINLGLRHILLVYPLLYVLAGGVAPAACRAFGSRKAAAILAAVAVLAAGEVLAVAPDYLAFFNRVAGGPDAGSRYLADSNLDWGQDINGLADYLRAQGDPEVVLSYFGSAPPDYYGIAYQNVLSKGTLRPSRTVNSDAPRRELLAVSLTNLVGAHYRHPDSFRWLAEKTPLASIGRTIRVYDITADSGAHENLLRLYRMNGEAEPAHREERRLRLLHGN